MMTPLLQGPVRLAILAGVLAFGAMGVALALAGAGLPVLLAAALASAAAGFVLYAALRQQPPPDRLVEEALRAEIEAHRAATAGMRHDLRGVLSPALMMSDRLLKHPDATVQRAGHAVVRSVERATALLSTNREVLSGEKPGLE